MEYFLAILMLCVCSYTVIRMFKERNVLWLMIGIIGVFSIGYYVLPVFFKKYSHLGFVDSNDLVSVLFMSFLFFIFIILGVEYADRRFKKKHIHGPYLNNLDRIFVKNYKVLFFIGLGIWLLYYFTNDLTSYSAEDFEAFFHERSKFAGLLASLSNISLAVMAVSTAISLKGKKKLRYLFIILYLVTILLLLVTGQRLAVITPLFMLVAAFLIYVGFNISIRIIGIGIIMVFFISPVMVFFREFQGETGKVKALEAAKDYESGGMESGLISIMNRADLLYVMTELKKQYDKDYYEFDHLQYLSSVFFAYVPKVVYADKPYPLSDNGQMNREISVEAWQLMIGYSTGSLSAFGAISAYREGGWIWVMINGFLTGMMFVGIYCFLAKGGHIGKLLFVSIFVTLCVRNVPPSFFYVIVFLVPVVYYLIVFYVLNGMMSKKNQCI